MTDTGAVFPVELDALTTPLAHFGQLHQETLRRHGNRTIDLSYPNPREHHDRRPYEALADLAATLDVTQLRYSPPAGFTSTRRRIAAALTQRHSLPYAFEDILITAGAAAAVSLCLQATFSPPDRVMVITPCWMDYPLYLAHLGLGCDMVPATDRKHLDLDAIAKAWTPTTRGLILSQPSSPSGVVYSESELRELTQLLRFLSEPGSTPTLISDETHRDCVWGSAEFCSPVPLHPRSFSLYSFGKAWQMQGQHTGYLAISPRHPLRSELSQLVTAKMRAGAYFASTALMQHLASRLIDYTPRLASLQSLQARARETLSAAGFDVVPADSTPFVYARSPHPDATHFVRLLAQKGVLAMPSNLFHEQGFFRLALNVGEAPLDHALGVLRGARTTCGAE